MSDAELKQKSGEHPLGHAGQIASLVVFMAVWAADSFHGHWSTFLARSVPLGVRLALLVLCLGASVALIRSAAAVHHIEGEADHVVTTGAFRRVRHPIYLGVMLIYKGLALATASLLALGVLACIFFYYNYISAYEERILAARFGAAYEEYKARTPKWVPRLRRTGGS